MESSISDKYTQFVLDNHRNIEALLEVYEHGKACIPKLADKQTVEAIRTMRYGFFKNQGINYLEEDTDEISWGKDSKCEYLLYFGFENGQPWNWIGSNEPEEMASFYLYINVEDVGKRKGRAIIDEWVSFLDNHRETLTQPGIQIVDEIDYDTPYLLWYSLQRVVSIDDLKDRESFKKKIQQAVEDFTAAVLPVLKLKDQVEQPEDQ